MIAARIYEARRGDPGFDQSQLQRAVSDAVIGEGLDVDKDTILEATKGMVTKV
jgi:hypothetical protein